MRPDFSAKLSGLCYGDPVFSLTSRIGWRQKMKLIGLAWMVAAIAAAQGNWQTIRDRRGASLQVPAGWQAVVDSSSTRITVTGAAGERMVIWPVYLTEEASAQTASAMVARVAAKLDPAVQWNATTASAGSGAVRVGGKGNGVSAVCSASWVNSPRGSAMYFVLSEAPQAAFATASPTFARIFSSVQLSAPTGGGQQSARWNEPREQAFSIEVPADWRIEGGTVRRAATDVVHTIAMTAPDGSARVTGGDADIPTFTLPNQMLAMAGFREGSWYSPGYGVRMMVRRYMPGVAFAKSYVQSKVAQGCASLQFTQEQDRTRDFGAINAQYAQFRQMGMNVQVSAGEVSFTCTRAGQPMTGYYFASTLLTNLTGNGIWAVDSLYGYLATPGGEESAALAMSHGLETFQFNPQWLQMQSNIAMQTSRIVSQTNAEISKMSKSSYEYKQRVNSEAMRKWSNATLGLVDARDPVSGRELKVDNAANYHWIDGNGKITGTQTDTRPAGVDVRMLVTLP
jgi:hypothetical protein